jgi:glycosyltransferase involved in cell wall biosynthesis
MVTVKPGGATSDGSSRPTVIRFVPVVRSVALENAPKVAESEYLYLRNEPDFDLTLDPSPSVFTRTSFTSLIRKLLNESYDIVEVPEPLFFRYLPHLVAVVSTIRIRDFASKRRTRVVCHAIENTPIINVPKYARKFGRLWPRVVLPMVRFATSQIDRIAFGTTDAAENLSRATKYKHDDSRWKVFPWLPQVCNCETRNRNPHQVLFVGKLSPYKGLDVLLDAWSSVSNVYPDARLLVAGDGPLSESVARASTEDPTIVPLGMVGRAKLHELYRVSSTVVLLSQPAPGRQEQIGHPIVEGVAHGCKVVTTELTGLAAWLNSQGQSVLSQEIRPSLVARELLYSLRQESLRYTLPPVYGKTEADSWLVT